jgi:hypothetical protein
MPASTNGDTRIRRNEYLEEAEARSDGAGEAQQQFNQPTDRWHCVSEQSQSVAMVAIGIWT